MVASIVREKNRILPAAAFLDGEYGIKGIFMGVPLKLNWSGIEEIIELPLTEDERKQLMSSAEAVRKSVASLKV